MPNWMNAIWVAAAVLVLGGCGIIRCQVCGDQSSGAVSAGSNGFTQQNEANRQPILISVTGYGALDAQAGNKAQRLLMALRASEVDAYRRLVERVQGIQISSNTKVMDFMTSYDHLKAVVDSYIHSARITSQTFNKEGFYETSLSLALDANFFQHLNRYESVTPSSQPESGSDTDDMKSETTAVNSATLSSSRSNFDLGSGNMVMNGKRGQ